MITRQRYHCWVLNGVYTCSSLPTFTQVRACVCVTEGDDREKLTGSRRQEESNRKQTTVLTHTYQGSAWQSNHPTNRYHQAKVSADKATCREWSVTDPSNWEWTTEFQTGKEIEILAAWLPCLWSSTLTQLWESLACAWTTHVLLDILWIHSDGM